LSHGSDRDICRRHPPDRQNRQHAKDDTRPLHNILLTQSPKVFCPAFLQKSWRGPGAAPLAARRSGRNPLRSPKRRKGGKGGNPRRGVPPVSPPPTARLSRALSCPPGSCSSA